MWISVYDYFNISVSSWLLSIVSQILSLALVMLILSLLSPPIFTIILSRVEHGKDVIKAIIVVVLEAISLVVWYNLYLFLVDILVS